MDQDFQRRMQEAAERFRAGESDVVDVEGPDGAIRFLRDPDVPGRVLIETEAGGQTIRMAMRSFGAAPERPADYPAHLPFLPDCPVMVNETAGTVTWLGPADPERGFERVVEECVADGWRRLDLHPVIAGTGGQQQAELERGGEERTVMLLVREGHATLTLMHRRTPPVGDVT